MKTNSSLRSNIKNKEEIVYSRLSGIDLNKIAVETGFRERREKKISPKNFLLGFFLMALGSRSNNTLENWAIKIGFLIGETVSKQAIFKRIKKNSREFLKEILQEVIKSSLFSPHLRLTIQGFSKIFIQDSTSIKLNGELSEAYPGAVNQHKDTKSSILKIQAYYDLVKSSFKSFHLTSYRQNDQSMSAEILSVAEKGDLVIRDLGYFVLEVFKDMIRMGIYFISRLQYGVNIYDENTKEEIDLLKLLRSSASVDRTLLLGSEQMIPVRLVAIKLDEKTATERRRRAREHPDKRKNHSDEYYELLGWKVLITNVKKPMVPKDQIFELYGLRFRIEVIFKSWKSYFKLEDAMTYKNKLALEVYIYMMLIFIVLFQVNFLKSIESSCCSTSGTNAISILKYSKFIADNIMIILILEALGINIFECFLKLLLYYSGYQKRRGRLNFNDKKIKLS